jgi:hypothetical protein
MSVPILCRKPLVRRTDISTVSGGYLESFGLASALSVYTGFHGLTGWGGAGDGEEGFVA